ncbi:MAG: hypothetical protein GY759_22240 [Chloroflexi bacterium]|nr:hypothetical protein [Chloroflexota bacterium]
MVQPTTGSITQADISNATHRRKISWAALIAIALALAIFFIAQTTHPIVPSEDAYISFRYARNLAEGSGLVWNVGEDPVEGSTEFLWVVLVAAVHRAGLDIETAATLLNFIVAAFTVVVMGIAAYVLSRRQALVVFFAAGALAAGPLAYHTHTGFATSLFSLLLIILFVAQITLVFGNDKVRGRRLAFVMLPLASLLLGLTRPEGVLFAVMALLATLILLSRRDRIRLLKYTLVLLIIPGLIYFVWRWQYFGYLLPNTFYVKNMGSLLHFNYFFDIYELFRFLAPLLLLIGVGLAMAKRNDGWRAFVLLSPAFLFPWSYLLIDQLQNIGQRFQYPVYPIFLLAAAAALGVLAPVGQPRWTREHLRRQLPLYAGLALAIFALFVTIPRTIFMQLLVMPLVALKLVERWLPNKMIGVTTMKGIGLILVAVFAIFNIQQSFRIAQSFYPTRFDDRQIIGAALEPYADLGYTLVASEAGWLPYFSRWRAIDPFGLNDEEITHKGLTAEYLDDNQPDIIMYHDVPRPDPPRWSVMTDILEEYAVNNGYTLAAVVERRGPQDLHVYYVRTDNERADELINHINGQEGIVYQYRAP